MSEQDPILLFGQMMKLPDGEIDLARAALLIARTEYPQLDVAAEIERLDRLARAVRIAPRNTPQENIRALNEVLFEQENFCANLEDYEDPRNSYLNDVLARKKGIPITLSLVYLEVARRLLLPVVGVSFPGHFLVKYLAGSDEIIIDPYHRGAIVTLEDCRALLQAHFGKETEFEPRYLDAAMPKQILARMLNNLKGTYSRRQNYPKVLTMIELSVAIDPSSRQDIRDRGMIYLAMKRYREAMADFKDYLAKSPEGDPQVQEVLQELHRIRAMMN